MDPLAAERKGEKGAPYKGTITITFGDVSETGVGMVKNGDMASSGFSREEMVKMYWVLKNKGADVYLYDLAELSPGVGYEGGDATALFCKGGMRAMGLDPDLMLEELLTLEWDKRKKFRGKEVNANARWCLCFGDNDVKMDLENGVGTSVAFSRVPELEKSRKVLGDLFGAEASGLQAEGNNYYDPKACYIGWHGDAERRKVMAFRLGATIPIAFRWYKESQIISEPHVFYLNHGDFYIMGDKTVGFDWKKRKIPTLRHAAGEGPLKK